MLLSINFKRETNKLREKLEEVVERATVKMKKESQHYKELKTQIEEYKNQYKVKAKELSNAHKQLDIANKESRSLKYRLETNSNEEVLNQLMYKNNEFKKENDELHKEIKA